METYIIELCGERYHVRIKDGKRQVLFCGLWIDSSDFVDCLFESCEYDQIAELAKPGDRINKGMKP